MTDASKWSSSASAESLFDFLLDDSIEFPKEIDFSNSNSMDFTKEMDLKLPAFSTDYLKPIKQEPLPAFGEVSPGSSGYVAQLKQPTIQEYGAPMCPQQTFPQIHTNQQLPTQQLPVNQPVLQLTLFHKPRGSGGAWLPINENDRIRVTKNKGKKLRVRVECNMEFSWPELRLALYDLISLSEVRDGFVVDDKKSTLTGKMAEVELNLFQLSKKLQFVVTLISKHGWTRQASTISFTTHNNGKDKLKYPATPTSTSSPISSPSSQTPDPFPDFSMDQTNGQANLKKRKLESGSFSEGGAGTVVVPSSMTVNGVVRAQGFIQYSDLRLKTNVADLVDALETVRNLKGKTYEWKEDTPFSHEKGGKRVIGLIAQEVQRVAPEVVSEDPATGYLSVNYVELVPVLIQALKEHLYMYEEDKREFQKELDELRTTLGNLALAQPAGDVDADGPAPQANGNDLGARFQQVKLSTNNFTLPMSPEQLEVVTKWAEEFNVKLDPLVRRNIKKSNRIHKKEQRKQMRETKKQSKKSAREALLEQLSGHRNVLPFARKMFNVSQRLQAKLILVLFWPKVDLDLSLKVTEAGAQVSATRIMNENKKKKWSIVAFRGNYEGSYQVDADVLSEHLPPHTHPDVTVAIFDFRKAGVQPLCTTKSFEQAHGSLQFGNLVVDEEGIQWGESESGKKRRGSGVEGGRSVLSRSINLSEFDLSDDDDSLPLTSSPSTGKKFPKNRRVFLRNSSGQYLSASSGSRQVCCRAPKGNLYPGSVASPSEAWDLEFDKGGYLHLKSCFGKYLSTGTRSSDSSPCCLVDEVGIEGKENFRYILDDEKHTLILISMEAKYVCAETNGKIVAVNSMISPSPSDSPLLNSQEVVNDLASTADFRFYGELGEGAKLGFQEVVGENGTASEKGSEGDTTQGPAPTDIPPEALSGSLQLYEKMKNGVLRLGDLKGTLEFYKHLSEGAKNLEKPDPVLEKSLEFLPFRLPSEEEIWILHPAPSNADLALFSLHHQGLVNNF
eukprot:CAMPEP_0174252104 /NCGR_PEP_ID=MMETSP0439-20130205/1718_1 /TAXON_ID=0 /ORGANISM="Stereomyxa ramosa, Strain Chinc5" /LENGTH=1009 /DNA_ID=CAMNT_0015332601 /DNA_START=55 /DNA_END=3084 /DNA_ORIENTATION=-